MIRRFKGELILVVSGLCLLSILYLFQELSLGTIYDYGYRNHVSTIGVPLDDTYIHCQYAKNLLAGHGYSFNAPDQVTADTSPLWVVLLAGGGLLTSHLEVVAVLLSALCWLLLAPGVFRFARYALGLGYGWSLATGFLMLLNARLLMMALSGMETTLAVLLGLMAMEMHIYSRQKNAIRIREAIVIGLALATRPEFFLFAAILAGDWILAVRKNSILRSSLVSYFGVVAVFAVAVVSLPLSIEGKLSYHSSIVQGAGFRLIPDLFYIAKTGYIIIECYILLLVYIGIRLIKLRQTTIPSVLLPAVLFIIALPILQSFIAPQYRHFGRYVFIVFPFLVLCIACAVSAICAHDGVRSRTHKILVAVLAGIPLLLFDGRWIDLYGKAVDNINDQHLAIVDWLDHQASGNEVLAADDVGAIAYFTNRKVLDLTGLVSPEFFPVQHDQKEVWRLARSKGATLFILYTRLNPEFYAYAKDSLELVQDFRISGPLVSSADTTMGIYKVRGAAHAAE